MNETLKRLGVDIDSFRLAYLFGKDRGRRFVRGALIFPGIRVADLEKVAARRGVSAQSLIDKRNAMLDGIVEFLEALFEINEEEVTQ